MASACVRLVNVHDIRVCNTPPTILLHPRYAALVDVDQPKALWMDVASLKVPAAKAFAQAHIEAVGLHPMCAPPPIPTLQGRKLVVCEDKPLARWGTWFKNFLVHIQGNQVSGTCTLVSASEPEHAPSGNLVPVALLSYVTLLLNDGGVGHCFIASCHTRTARPYTPQVHLAASNHDRLMSLVQAATHAGWLAQVNESGAGNCIEAYTNQPPVVVLAFSSACWRRVRWYGVWGVCLPSICVQLAAAFTLCRPTSGLKRSLNWAALTNSWQFERHRLHCWRRPRAGYAQPVAAKAVRTLSHSLCTCFLATPQHRVLCEQHLQGCSY